MRSAHVGTNMIVLASLGFQGVLLLQIGSGQLRTNPHPRVAGRSTKLDAGRASVLFHGGRLLDPEDRPGASFRDHKN